MAQQPNEVGRETDEIKHEIERTRVEMSETLGEIQERLRPDHLIQQAKDTVTEAASGKMRSIMSSAGETATMMADQTRYAGQSLADYARTHPLQMALVAGGVTWWLLRDRGRSNEWAGASEGWHEDSYAYDDGQSLRNRVGDAVSTARETVGEYASTARETVGQYAASARETVGGYADSARTAATDASERVGSAARTASMRARESARQATTTVDDWVHENPLAAGALAVAVGAAIGLSVRGTEFEDRTLGERRDLAMARARSAAREITDNITQKVERAAESVLDATNAATASTTSPTQGRS